MVTPLTKVEKMGIINDYFVIYRWSLHLILFVAALVFALVNFDCDVNERFCPSNDTRKQLLQNGVSITSLIYCGLIQIISPFYYQEIKRSGLTDKVATIDRTLNELIKLQDWNGIKELNAFGFLFDKDAYLDILFNGNYELIGCETFWKILTTLKNVYKYEYRFSIRNLQNQTFERRTQMYRICELIIDLKSSNINEYEKMKKQFSKSINFDLSIMSINKVNTEKEQEIRKWAQEWIVFNFRQFNKFAKETDEVLKYLGTASRELLLLFSSEYSYNNYNHLFDALTSIGTRVELDIESALFKEQFQQLLTILTDLRRFDQTQFDKKSKDFPKVFISNVNNEEGFDKLKESLPVNYDRLAVETMFPRINKLEKGLDEFQSDLKVALIGSNDHNDAQIAGAQSVARHFILNDSDMGEFDPTIEDSFYKDTQVILNNGEKAQCKISIVCNVNDEFNVSHDDNIRQIDCFILVYSVQSRNSFNKIEDYLKLIARTHEIDEQPLFIVIAGRLNGHKINDNNLEITKGEGDDFAKNVPILLATQSRLDESNFGKVVSTHFQISIKTGQNIQECFHWLVKSKNLVMSLFW